MPRTIMISLTIFACFLTAGRALADQLVDAPELSAWPQGLPKDGRSPEDGSWMWATGKLGGAGTWLPRELADAVHRRLEEAAAMPARCASRLTELAKLCASEESAARSRCAQDTASAVDVALAEDRARRLAEQAPPATGYGLTTVLSWSGGALALGVVAGIALTFALTSR